jgi:cysteine-rich repeat protein
MVVASLTLRASAAHAGASLIPESLFELGRCGNTPTSPACTWDCNQPNQQGSNPTCANAQASCVLNASQGVTTLTARAAFRVNDDACLPGGPAPQTRLSLRLRAGDGTEFSIDDRLLDFCAAGGTQCGSCDPDASCTAQDTSCPLEPVFLCGAFGLQEFNESVVQGTGGPGLTLWLQSFQPLPASMSADIANHLPATAGTLPVIVDVRETAAINDDPNDGFATKREYCLQIVFINAPRQTFIPDYVGQTSPSSLTDMGSCGGCGDGRVGPGEQCDDGNTTAGDGCDASCQREPCFTCDAGQPSVCQPVAAMTGCRQPGPLKALLQIKDQPPGKRDSVKWSWSKGDATAVDALGDPLGSDSYDLCLYRDSGSRPLLIGLRAPAGGTCDGAPCWSTRKDGGFKFANKSGLPGGLTAVVLKPGDLGKSKASALGKGDQLALPPLPLALPVLAQLQREGTTECWEARYADTGVVKSDQKQFKGKAD